MKNIILVLILFTISFVVFSQNDDIQDVNNIVPPSPTAQSFHKFGNTNVSLYTGTPNIEIPIFTIKTKNLTLPITLRYSDGNGVRVNEVASWVGLGWTLNTGGSVTRTIKDLPDDYGDIGYYYKPYPVHNTDPVENQHGNGDANDMHYKVWDGDPDVFNYNFSGNSGSFFIKKNIEGGGVLQKPIKNIKIDPIWNNSNSCSLDAFTITDSDGSIYSFEEKEIEAALTLFGGSSIPSYMEIPTSWYINKITNDNLTEEIVFDYRTISPGTYYELSPYLSENSIFTETTRQRKTIRRPIVESITFPDGIIEFISQQDITVRNDKQDTYLQKILVKNNNGEIIKEFNFNYSYFGSDGIIPFFENGYDGVYSDMRLKLNSVTETGKPAYVFTYNESNYLPDRFEYSIDHWGYYNGKNNNTSFQNFKTSWYLGVSFGGGQSNYRTREYGDADRSPDEGFSKSLILTEIQYPTGGKTVFEYEQNIGRVDNNEFFTDYNEIAEYYALEDSSQQNQGNLFINVVSGSLAKIFVNGYDQQSESICSKKIVFSNTEFEFNAFLNSYNNYTTSILLPNGTYNISWNYYSAEGEEPNLCANNNNLDENVSIMWHNEFISPVKEVGGLRIKSITDFADEQVLQKIYTYEDNDGLSSGRLSSQPYYGHFFIACVYYGNPAFPTVLYHIDFMPELHSSVPLTTTSGSVVGYRKVVERIIKNDISLGKTEYIYTTAEEYPDLAGATPPWTQDFDPDLMDYYYSSVNDFYMKPHPFGQADSYDIQRGLLLKKVDYKIIDETDIIVQEIENEYYCNNVGGTEDKLSILPINIEYIEGHVKYGNVPINDQGVSADNWRCEQFHDYRIYCNYQFKLSEKTTSHFGTGDVVSETIYNYDFYDENVENPLYFPTQITTTLSDGSEKHIDFIYPRDVEQIVGLEPEEISAINEMKTRNIFTPIQTTVTKDNTLLEKKRSNFNLLDGENDTENLFIVGTEKSFGDAPLQEEMFYQYDSQGNILQYYKLNDIKTTIIWGYNDTYPIAKIAGIAYDDLTSQQKSKILELDNTEWTFSNRVQLENLNTQIRDILPDDVMISTYSYIPLVGTESETGPNGQTIFYEYDSFGKLEVIRDQNGDIMKRIEYHYKNEQQ